MFNELMKTIEVTFQNDASGYFIYDSFILSIFLFHSACYHSLMSKYRCKALVIHRDRNSRKLFLKIPYKGLI